MTTRLALLATTAALLLAPPIASAQPIYAIDDGAPPALLSFDSALPGTITSVATVTGLKPGEHLVGIDFDPADGRLYGVGDTNRLYRIDAASGAATAVSTSPFVPALSASTAGAVGTDFDPVGGELRISTNTKQNLRVSPVTGQVTHVDSAWHPGDGTVFANPEVVALAYSGNVPRSASTFLYGYEFQGDDVVSLGSPSGPTAPETGTVYKVGDSGVATSASGRIGFDIAPDGTAYVALQNGTPQFNLYLVSLGTGHLTLVGPVGNGGAGPRDIAVAPVTNRFRFSAASYTVDEGAGTATIGVDRAGSLLGGAAVRVNLTNGTAVRPLDYSTDTGVLAFAPGQAQASLTVPIVGDDDDEADETVNLALANPSGGAASLGSPATATLTIRDDDVTPAVSLSVPKSLKLARFLKGFTATATPSVPARLDFELLGIVKRATLSKAANGELLLDSRSLALAGGKRSAKLKPSRRLVGKPRRGFKVRVRVVAVDAAGRRSKAVTKTVNVTRPKRKKH